VANWYKSNESPKVVDKEVDDIFDRMIEDISTNGNM
jgi:hypothetical protein